MSLIIAANWKMYKTAADTTAYCRTIRQKENNFSGVEVLICPPYTALASAAEALQGSSLKLGAQNMHYETEGAFTGEIAASMLLEYNVQYVIIGHSERRHLSGEDDSLIRRKMKTALESGLLPILCVGETEKEYAQGLTAAVIEKQLAGALEGLDPEKTERLVVAYEPVWAIGSGKAASADDADNAALLIRKFFLEKLGEKAAAGLRIQYGGSVKADNIGSFVARPSIQGALVGGASLDADTFSELIRAARKVVSS